jgi:hypothetical protein
LVGGPRPRREAVGEARALALMPKKRETTVEKRAA